MQASTLEQAPKTHKMSVKDQAFLGIKAYLR
jgi:hypothetical protein